MTLPSPFTYFKHISVINLASRTDRLAQVMEECSKEGFTPEVLTGTTPEQAIENSPFVAFNTSQQRALMAVKKYPALILEDDCVFKNTMHLNYAMNELPPDWECLYLGANVIGIDTIPFDAPVRYSSHLFTVKDAWQTHAVAYSEIGIAKILGAFKVNNGYCYDEWLRQNILPNGKSFIIAPQIAYQRESFSDIWNVPADYTSLFNRGNKLLV